MPARRKLSVSPRTDGGWAVTSGRTTLSTQANWGSMTSVSPANGAFQGGPIGAHKQILSATAPGAVATITTAAPHGFIPSQSVTIAGQIDSGQVKGDLIA